MITFIHKLYQGLLKIEIGFIVALLLSLILIAMVQIILRNFFDSGLFWAESYIRISVLWMALLGAMVASRRQQHLAIDVFVHKLNAKKRAMIEKITHIFTGLLCFIMAYHSSLFIHSEYQEGSIAFAIIPTWICEIIIPITFLIIGVRYFIAAVFNLPQAKL